MDIYTTEKVKQMECKCTCTVALFIHQCLRKTIIYSCIIHDIIDIFCTSINLASTSKAVTIFMELGIDFVCCICALLLGKLKTS